MKRVMAACLLLVCCGTVVPACTGSKGPSDDPNDKINAGKRAIVRGGLLYDKWFKVLDKKTEGNQPLWSKQTSNTREGGTTWRCKECHGWDYLGKEGAYAKGSHFTGFAGVLAASSKSEEELTKALTSGDHDFSAMGKGGVSDMVAFLKNGMVDVRPFIDASDKSIKGGNVEAGKKRYTQTCQECHGAKGLEINFGDADKPEGIGYVARKNPWEFFHKVRFGHPGTKMPSGVQKGWSIEDVRDVTAFGQTLNPPPKAPEPPVEKTEPTKEDPATAPTTKPSP